MLTRMNTTRHDLSACFVPDGVAASRQILVKETALTMLYLSLGPGQVMPEHNHPGCAVAIQGMVGESTVQLDGEPHPLESQQLLTFSGELMVSLRNDSSSASAVLITLSRTT